MALAEENKTDFGNISKVANVEVKLSAILGRAKLKLHDVIEYDTGSVIMLNEGNNDPVDIYVNDVLIAKGKIVAIEDTYGVKIVEIVDNSGINK
ncbi:MAG: FliM/FliN family flagellar motor switch protein [Candidatus Gastranaerophilales bacterium]|nr:FliM/FliN family flagellar motor switch protein [Candidatus Gastranaerophilales bacterium]